MPVKNSKREVHAMRAFWHINEFEFDVFDVLPFALLCSRDLVLWAPAAKRLNLASEKQGSNYDARAILKLVESGSVRIAGRHKWIMDSKWRNAQAWVQGHWEPEFDEEIRRLAIQDQGKPEARVMICDDEDGGYVFADQELDKRTSNSVAISDKLYKTGRVPLGTRERAARKAAAADKSKARAIWLREIMRDAYNHEWSRTHVAKADIPIETEEFPPEFAQIGQRSAFEARVDRVDMKRVLELAEICYELGESARRDTGKAPSLDDIMVFKRKHRPDEEMGKLIGARLGAAYQQGEVLAHLMKQFQDEEAAVGGLLQHVFGDDLKMYVNALGSAATVVGFATTNLTRRDFLGRAGATAAVVSLSCAGTLNASSAAEWFSAAELSTYKGPRWPFILRYGKPAPTIDQLRQLMVELRKIDLS